MPSESGQVRIIYQVNMPVRVVLVTLYSKLDQTDISAGQIRRIISEFEQHHDLSASL